MTETLEETVMRVISGQSRDYFIYPNASAFHAEGLAADAVAHQLEELEAAGVLERELVPFVVGETEWGEEITDTVAGGYRLKLD